ncbi:MAG: hypothetical protein K2M10_05070 [Muribaculaceae bacterium]|nr:hypothetical protein [Muribaculaceae bacterium]
MNQWITPDGGEAGLEYVLTDDNGDGWYTGSFQIESGELQFKIFSEIAGWGKEEAYFGSTSGSGMQLFAQAPTESDARNDGYGIDNIQVKNWNGGTFSIKVKFDNIDEKKITILAEGDNQPEMPGCEKVLYAVGEFNDWKLPDSSGLNGSLEIPIECFTFIYNWDGNISYAATYNGEIEIPAGKCNFNIYNKSQDPSQPIFFTTDYPAFTLTRYPSWDGNWRVNKIWGEMSAGDSIEDGKSIQCANWEGGSLYINISSFGPAGWWEPTFSVTSGSAPDCPFINQEMYAICSSSWFGKKLFNLNMQLGLNQDILIYGDSMEVTFTTENSLNPSPDNIYGIREGEDSNIVIGSEERPVIRSLVKGGTPLIITAEDYKRLKLNPNWINGVVEISASSMGFRADTPEKLFITGNFNSDFYNNPEKYELTKNADGNFEGSFFIDSKDLGEAINNEGIIFNFIGDNFDYTVYVSTLVGGGNVVSPTKLEGEEWSEDGCVCSLYSGGGSWCVSSWETGYLNVVVNLEDDTIKFRRTETSAVGEIAANGNQYNSIQP